MPNQADLVFLSSLCFPDGTSGFIKTLRWWDKAAREVFTEVAPAFACQTYSLPEGTQVDEWCDADSTRHIIRWSQLGQQTFEEVELNSTSCPVLSDLVLLAPQLTYPSASGANDGRIVVPYTTPATGGVIGVLSNGQQDSSAGTIGQLEFTDMLAGIYTLDVEDGDGNTARLTNINLTDAVPPAGEPYWLQFTSGYLEPDGLGNGGYYVKYGTAWDFVLKAVFTPPRIDGTAFPFEPDAFVRDVNQIVDAYFLPDGVTFRQVRHDGAGGVRYTDTVPGTGPGAGVTLRLENAIITHVVHPGQQTGSVLLEARSTTPGFITYTRLPDDAESATQPESNTHGRFDALPAGTTRFRIQDAGGQSIEEPILIEDRYRLRWALNTFDRKNHPMTVELYGRDFTGEATEVRGSAESVVRSWDAAGGAEGTLPEAAGQQLTLSLQSQFSGQFLACKLGDDRSFYVVYRRADRVLFRGYLLPDFYEEDLSRATGGLITLTAADGLGVLRDTAFLSHVARPLGGRWPLLHTLLHCLSRCSVGEMPLYVQTGLLDAGMPNTGEALALACSDREVYRESGASGTVGKEWSCRQVVEALLQPFYAMLVQRDGAWWVTGANAAATATTYFAYAANGTPLAAQPAPAVHYLKPPTYTTADVYWRERAQRLGVLAAARAVVATTQLQLVANQLADGLLQTWTPLADRPLGWDGALLVSKLPHESKAGVSKLRIGAQQPATGAPGLKSPAIPFQDGASEAPVLVQLRVRVPELVAGEEVKAIIRVQGYVGGQPQPSGLHWEVGSGEKEVTVEGFLPLGVSHGQSLRLELLPATDADAPTQRVTVDVYEVVLRIQPSGVEWPKDDQVTGENPAGFYVLPQVDLVHADIPRLPLPDGTFPPVIGMDALAWRHALTLTGGGPTTLWRRADSIKTAPLLETATLDRLNLRRTPQLVLTGPVAGPDAPLLGVGSLVEVSYDAPGARFWVIGCEVHEARAEATLTLRQIGVSEAEPLPLNRRVTGGRQPRRTDEGFTRAWK